MRVIRISQTARRQLKDLLTVGINQFGPEIAGQTLTRVEKAVHFLLINFPDWFAKESQRGLHIFAVPHTPVIIAYNFDDTELRVYFIFHSGQNRSDWNSSDAQW